MMGRFSGRQTQFYIDVVYGAAFALAFGYLLVYGMDARVVAFQGGLIFGYFLRVWENMTVYERLLAEEVAERAEAQVAEEVETRVPTEAEEAVAEEIEDRVPSEAQAAVAEEVEAQVSSEAEEAVAEEIESQVGDEVEERLTDETEERVVEDVETELLDRLGEVDEDLAAELERRLEDRA